MSTPGQTTTPPTPSVTADLQYSDTEEALRDSVRRLFADRLPADAVVKAYESDAPDFSQVWRTLAADLGPAALLIPESLGGAGASEREAAVVCEEIGRAVAPVPFLSSAIIATAVLLQLATPNSCHNSPKAPRPPHSRSGCRRPTHGHRSPSGLTAPCRVG